MHVYCIRSADREAMHPRNRQSTRPSGCANHSVKGRNFGRLNVVKKSADTDGHAT